MKKSKNPDEEKKQIFQTGAWSLAGSSGISAGNAGAGSSIPEQTEMRT